MRNEKKKPSGKPAFFVVVGALPQTPLPFFHDEKSKQNNQDKTLPVLPLWQAGMLLPALL
jgi:hypothetical protein